MALISVIVPNYNHASFLALRLESIFNQTYQDFEVILMDDCSSDNSVEILKRYKDHPKVSGIILNESNSGSPFRQWLKGISRANGNYIWVAESDDYARHDFLEKVMSRFVADPGLTLVYAHSIQVNEKGEVLPDLDKWLEEMSSKHWSRDYVASGTDEIRDFLSVRNTIPNASAVVMPRPYFLEFLPLVLHFRYTGDWYLWLNVLSKPGTKIAFISEHLNFFRSHDKTTRTLNKKAQYIAELYRCLFFARKKGIIKNFNSIAIQDMAVHWHFYSISSFLKNFTFRNLMMGVFMDKKILIRLLKNIFHHYKRLISS